MKFPLSPIHAIRVAFLICCVGGGYVIWLATHTTRAGDESPARYLAVAALLGALLILVDMALKGFSLRSLTSLTFGIGVGTLLAYLLSISPLLDVAAFGDNDAKAAIYAIKIGLFIASAYLATVITLRARDEFNLVIPYVRFNPLDTPAQQVVVDTTALIDGRITGLCETGFFTADIVLPRFVIEELQTMSASPDQARRARGRRGLANLNALKEISGSKLRIHESGAPGASGTPEDRLVALTASLKAALLSADYNVAQLARFRNVKWLNLNALAKAMKYELSPGDVVEVELSREGREPGQAIGYLPDGSMVVVADGAGHIGRNVAAEVVNQTPTSAGRMIFAKIRTPMP